jgi:uncharacterized protein YxeA
MVTTDRDLRSFFNIFIEAKGYKMRKILITVLSILFVIVICIGTYDFIFKVGVKTQTTYQKIDAAQIDSNYIIRKSQMMLKDYDTAFDVVGRETQLIYNFRGWEITLLVLLLTLFTSKATISPRFMRAVGLYIMIAFFLLELSERIVINHVMQQLLTLETILDLKTTREYNLAAYNYQFRDIRDVSIPLLDNKSWKTIEDPKIYLWYIFIVTTYFILVNGIKKIKRSPSKAS